jgi:hypothetical protein
MPAPHVATLAVQHRSWRCAGRAGPATPDDVAAAFDAAPVARVSEWLAALAALGQARVGEDGQYATA